MIKQTICLPLGKNKKRIMNIIKKGDYRVISFDIFDTLISRECGSSQGIFLNLQNFLRDLDENFKLHGVRAEK